MTRCKYCRELQEDIFTAHGSCVHESECRARMLSRERRVVRVYYRVRDTKGSEVMAEDWRPDAMRWKHRGYAVFKVTVRRKVKA